MLSPRSSSKRTTSSYRISNLHKVLTTWVTPSTARALCWFSPEFRVRRHYCSALNTLRSLYPGGSRDCHFDKASIRNNADPIETLSSSVFSRRTVRFTAVHVGYVETRWREDAWRCLLTMRKDVSRTGSSRHRNHCTHESMSHYTVRNMKYIHFFFFTSKRTISDK